MKRILLGAVFVFCLSLSAAWAEKTSVNGLSTFKLPNGLELFVLENHNVPLARIQICFRAGSIAQTADTAGLFHLYEHMLFKGNEVYKSQSEMTAAMTALGVGNWNGGTSNEYVTYFFTVPSDKADKGLEFWSQAMLKPVFSKEDLETEKSVVLNEIKGYLTDPGYVFSSAIDKKLFSKYPWRRDVSGYEKTIMGASVASMEKIRDSYYIPNNAAILVGGDVNPDEVYAKVNEYFGAWASGKDPWKTMPSAQPALSRQYRLVYPDPTIPSGYALVDVRYRGPDVTTDPKSTYAADVWGMLIDNPEGNFKKRLMKNVAGILDKDYISGYYLTQRDGGQIVFQTYLSIEGKQDLGIRAQLFKESVKSELTLMKETRSYFTNEEFELVKAKLEDQRILELETMDGFLETLQFWWASANADYFFNYAQNMKKVTMNDIANYLSKYVLTRECVISIRMNDQDYETQKKEIGAQGFSVINAKNAFWWQ